MEGVIGGGMDLLKVLLLAVLVLVHGLILVELRGDDVQRVKALTNRVLSELRMLGDPRVDRIIRRHGFRYVERARNL